MKANRLIVGLLTLWSGLAVAVAQDFVVDRYSVDINLEEAGYFEVVESYDITFSSPKHGIYRDILTSYTLQTGQGTTEKRQILISEIGVPGHRFEASGKFYQKINGQAQIKIGDPDKTVIGPMHYEIRYRVDNAFLFEQEATRFYWNLKPSDWLAPFRQVTFTVSLPSQAQADPGQVFLYTGTVGTTAPTQDFELQIADGRISGRSKPGFVSGYGEAVTLLVNLPIGSIAEQRPFWPFWADYGWTLILALVAGVFYWLFVKYGKDDPAPQVISYFPPDNLDPAMVGFLIDDKGDTSDLVSLLPYWGTRGLLEMDEIDKKGWFAKDDIQIRKLADLPADAPDYQKTVFNGLFASGESEVLVSSLKDKFYTTMNLAKKELKEAAQQYYDPKARRVYWFTGGGIVLALLMLLPAFFYFWGLVALFSGLGLCILLLILNGYMIKKNPKGIKLLSELKGFKAFIRTAEENRLKMLLAESPNYFESTMPYALAFGYLEGWAAKFEKLDVAPPNWYHAAGGYHSMRHFSRSFSDTMRTTSTTMVSSPSSSSSGGGGSSGGGFGGGGGGSW
jgi:uncharacterized membrane protein YgcG